MNENFVPYELAVKLKEKGFKQFCSHYYRTKCKDLFMVFPCEDWSDTKERINAPTISQVLKWLREEKVISVEPYASASGWRVTICRAYHQERTDTGGGTCLKSEVEGYNDGGAFEKYEEAALAGIKECLENMILV